MKKATFALQNYDNPAVFFPLIAGIINRFRTFVINNSQP